MENTFALFTSTNLRVHNSFSEWRGGGGVSISTRAPFLTPDVFSLSTSKILDSLQVQMYS